MINIGRVQEKVLVLKDEPDPVVKEASKLMYITLLSGLAATGTKLRPLAILPRQTMPPLPDDIINYYDITGTTSGWINGEILKNWTEGSLIWQMNHLRNEAM